MIPVPPLTREDEPPFFDINCRQPGNAWLAANPDKDPHKRSDLWSQFRQDLARHFADRCGWLAVTVIADADVEHMFSCGPRAGTNSPYRHLAFEWANFRYCVGTINSRKGILDDRILDPCEILDGWFKIELPTFILVATDKIPAGPLRQKASDTIEKLKLNNIALRRARWLWYRSHYHNGTANEQGLSQDAPLVAQAVASALRAGQAIPNPDAIEPHEERRARVRPYKPNKR